MSASTSCKERARGLLQAALAGDWPANSAIRAVGEECPAEFFGIVIEALSDSFDPAQAGIYERLMSAWKPAPDPVYVLSRVTLGADIKITGAILDAMKRRFPNARIVFVGGAKSAELFAADPRIGHLEMNYPRSGPVSARLAFAQELRSRLAAGTRIVVDPDSRMTQLGLIPACEGESYYRFPSRVYGGAGDANMTELTGAWLQATFGVTGEAYTAVHPVPVEGDRPRVAVSLGVGGNASKRLSAECEAQLIGTLREHYRTILIDRGAGGEEARRVTEAAGLSERVRFWEGSFAGFVSLIGQSDLYVGYDSAGQHAAAAMGTPLITLFEGAPSERFRRRWAPQGRGWVRVLSGGLTGLKPALLAADEYREAQSRRG